MAKNGKSYKSQVDTLLDNIGRSASGVVCKEKRNLGPFLWDIFVWQEIRKRSDKELKSAWARAQDKEVLPSDDDLRANGEGEHLDSDYESERLSLVYTVGKPRQNFDKEKFLLAVAREYKINIDDLTKLAESCKSEAKASLEKRIAEAR